MEVDVDRRARDQCELWLGGDWWEASVISLEGESARIHYTGGNSEEDETLRQMSGRIRQPNGPVLKWWDDPDV